MQQPERAEPREAPDEDRHLKLGVLGLAAVMAAVEKPAPEPGAAQPRR